MDSNENASGAPVWRPYNDAFSSSIPRPPIHRVVVTQFLLALSLAAIGWLFWEPAEGLSALLGATAHVLPHAYFMLRSTRFLGASQIAQAVRAARQGIVGKWMMTAAIFAVTFKFWPGVILPGLAAGYLVLQVSSWLLYPILINRPRKRTFEED